MTDFKFIQDAFELANYILANDREKEDFKNNPSTTHVYFIAMRMVDGIDEAEEELSAAYNDLYDRLELEQCLDEIK